MTSEGNTPAAAHDKQRRAVGVVASEEARRLSGLELLRGIAANRLPVAPISDTLDFDLVEVEPGRIVFAGVPARRLYNPLGSVHGGYMATLLDSAMSCAVHSTLPAGMGYTTLELKVNFIRPITEETGPVRAEGKLIHAGSRIGTAEGRIVDAQGRLYAHGTATCLMFPM